MNHIRNEDNDVNGTGTSCEGASSGRWSVGEQRRPGRNQATARMKWTKEMNIVVMECFYSARPFDISIAIELLQKTTILGTARILRKVLDY